MRQICKKEYFLAKRNSEDGSYDVPTSVLGVMGDVSSRVLASVSVSETQIDVGKVQKILNLSIADDNFDELDRVYLELPLDTDVLGKRADYEILGAMRGMFHVSYLLAKR